MKGLRGTKFYSQSPYSCFICSTTGAIYTGQHIAPYDVDFLTCDRGHIFNIEDAVNRTQSTSRVYDGSYHTFNDFKDFLQDGDLYYTVPTEYCPCCNMRNVSLTDCLKYLLKKNNLKDLINLKEKIIKEYPSYEALERDLQNISDKYTVCLEDPWAD